MRTKTDIVAELARDKVVEEMVMKISHSTSITFDLADLVQMVYVILLEYDETKIADLYDHNQIRFFLARIILNQFRSINSPFHLTIRKFNSITDDYNGNDWIDD